MEPMRDELATPYATLSNWLARRVQLLSRCGFNVCFSYRYRERLVGLAVEVRKRVTVIAVKVSERKWPHSPSHLLKHEEHVKEFVNKLAKEVAPYYEELEFTRILIGNYTRNAMKMGSNRVNLPKYKGIQYLVNLRYHGSLAKVLRLIDNWISSFFGKRFERLKKVLDEKGVSPFGEVKELAKLFYVMHHIFKDCETWHKHGVYLLICSFPWGW